MRMADIHRFAIAGDAAGVTRELAVGVPVDLRDAATGQTPLMMAAVSAAAGVDVVRLLIDAGADVNAVEGGPPPMAVPPELDALLADGPPLPPGVDRDDPAVAESRAKLAEVQSLIVQQNQPHGPGKPALSFALGAGSVAKVEALIAAGADVRYSRAGGYGSVLDAPHRCSLDVVRMLIDHGADANLTSSYGESPLSVASREVRADAVRLLLDAGADPSPLGWTALHRAVALGTIADVVAAVAGADLSARDRWERTPWLLAVAVGDVAKVRLLLSVGSDRADRGRCGKPPLTAAVESGHADVLPALLADGFDPDAADEFGETAVMAAVENDRAEAVRPLVAAGARVDIDRHGTPLIGTAPLIEMALLLADIAGADLADVNADVRRTLAHLPPATDGPDVSAADYHAGKHRRFGTANPERTDVPFWRAMVVSGCNAYFAQRAFDDADGGGPVWCHDRFGRTTTELPDGRVVQIGGEHEDFYDPDFCIYNDLTVHYPDGRFGIHSYPRAVFPPTDFHTATPVGGHVYLIGNVGYADSRRPGQTPVYRLDMTTLAMEPLPTIGDGPGWIGRHRARTDGSTIVITGGRVWTGSDLIDNSNTFTLDLATARWARVGPVTTAG